jgi:hypothetical protein
MWWRGHGRALRHLYASLLRWVAGIVTASATLLGLSSLYVSESTLQESLSLIRQYLSNNWFYLVICFLVWVIFYLHLKVWSLLNPKATLECRDEDYLRRGEISPADQSIMHSLHIMARNASSTSIRGSVQLEDIVTEVGSRPYGGLPMKLRTISGEEEFTLRPGATELLHVASAKQDSDQRQIYLCIYKETEQKYLFQLDSGLYDLTICLFSDGPSCKRKFRLYFDEKGTFHMKALGKPMFSL